MDTHLHLLIVTLGYAVSMLLVLGFGFFVFFQKERKPLHKAWFFFTLSLALYQLFFIIGINTSANLKIAYWIWYTNIALDILIGLSTLHVLILASEGLGKFKKMLKFMYGLGILIIGSSILFPGAFLVNVVPKLYFHSYVNATGPFYNTVVGYFLLAILLSFYVLFYERAHHGSEGKKRIDYFITGITFCFLTGVTAFAPDFNLPIDPGYSALIGIFVIPLVYGIMKKGLMDIRIAIRRTVVVLIVILVVATLLVTTSFLSNWLIANVPGSKFWMIPLLSALILVIIGFIYYKKEKGEEQLKYEFITVVAHKFRTPLTRIRWQTNELAKEPNLSPETRTVIEQISESNLELIRLSNLLINSSQQENYHYSYKNTELPLLVEKVLLPFKNYLTSKKINFSIETDPDLPMIYADEDKLDSAIHVLVENAITYTGESGTIRIKLSKEKDTVRFSITDSGIGIAEKDQARIFNRFYRGDSARRADTEGVGLGLYMAKSIIEHQGGSIGFDSPGVGKGSTFWFTFLAQKT
jgi:signal transduction histidine kinase